MNVYRLNQFGFLELTGVDAVKFMQGYTTCDLETLDNTGVKMGAICNIQGRMLASFLVTRHNDRLIFRLNRELIAPTIEFLGKYIVFSKAEMHDISDSLGCYGAPESSSLPMFSAEVNQDNGLQITCSLGNRQEIWAEQTLSTEIATESWTQLEVDSGIAWITPKTVETFLPHSLNYHNLEAIDFEKGCYLGQEIVARMQFRGDLKNKLHRIDAGLTPEQLDKGEIAVATQSASLVVLANGTSDPVELTLTDGRTVKATPV